LLIVGGCGNQPPHPNQINAFDGSSYDTLVTVHAALGSLRPTVAGQPINLENTQPIAAI
jgi:hypothetical protein